MGLVIVSVAKKMKISLKQKIYLFSLFFFLISFLAIYTLKFYLVKDFNEYVAGEVEDRVYWLTNYIEQRYEQEGKLSERLGDEILRLAFVMGFEGRLFDYNDKIVSQTEEAIERAPNYVKRRLSRLMKKNKLSDNNIEYIPYTLFNKGEEIGTLELKYLGNFKKAVFLSRVSNFLFFALAIAIVGTIVFGIILSKQILEPIKILKKASEEIGKGHKKTKVQISNNDELGDLANTFNKMAEYLYNTEEARKISVAKFAHELRTPLTIIQGEIEGLIDGVMPATKERFLSIHEEIERLKKMVFEIEMLYRIQKGAKFVGKSYVILREVVLKVLNRFEKEITEKRLHIDIAISEHLRICADEDKLKQLFYNLFSNSLSATDKGGITISAEEEKDLIKIKVIDTGKGIPEKDLPNIFDIFYGTTQGLGIGLAIVKEIINMLDGSIKISSKLNKGTTVEIFLPKN